MVRDRSESSDVRPADHHIERCLELIRAQESCVRRMRNLGVGADMSEELLALLRDTVEVMVFHREVMGWSADNGRGWTGAGRAEPLEDRTSRPGSSRPETPAAEPGTVLLVDDDPNVLGALETIVTEGGYEVFTAENGEDALAKARDHLPDVVVSDVMMPVMDGAALVDAMAADRELADIPVVLNSALATPPPVHVDAFLKKPYAPGQLLDLIRHLVEEHRHHVTGAMQRR